MTRGRRRRSGSRRRRSFATRCGPFRRCSDRQQKMATTELGHRDVFGMKLGPGGAVVQVFQVRRGRVVERIELGTEAAIGRRRPRPDVLDAAIQQFYELRDGAAGDPRADRAGRTRGARGLAVGRRRPQVRIVDAAARREARPGRPGHAQCGARAIRRGSIRRHDGAVRRARDARSPCWRCRRCRGASSASTSRRFRAARRWRRWWSAKTAGCARRLPEVPHSRPEPRGRC